MFLEIFKDNKRVFSERYTGLIDDYNKEIFSSMNKLGYKFKIDGKTSSLKNVMSKLK